MIESAAVARDLVIWDDYARTLAGLVAISGHSWSVFLKFKGGRGVATFIGGLLAIYWPAAVVGGVLVIFVGVLMLGLYYAVKKGVLEWK